MSLEKCNCKWIYLNTTFFPILILLLHLGLSASGKVCYQLNWPSVENRRVWPQKPNTSELERNWIRFNNNAVVPTVCVCYKDWSIAYSFIPISLFQNLFNKIFSFSINYFTVSSVFKWLYLLVEVGDHFFFLFSE